MSVAAGPGLRAVTDGMLTKADVVAHPAGLLVATVIDLGLRRLIPPSWAHST
jgi:hypothetical protein